jgi:hypothetical protein
MAFKFDNMGFLSGGKKVDNKSNEDTNQSTTEQKKKKNSFMSTIINKATTYNSTNSVSYEIPDNAVNATLGGDIGSALSELSGFFKIGGLFGGDDEKIDKQAKDIADRQDDNIKDTNKKLDEVIDNTNPNNKRRGRGKDKKPRKRRGETIKDTNEELKESNDWLKKIAKNSGGSGGSGKQKKSIKNPLSGLGKGFIARKFLKGLGGIGAMIGAVTGLQDYKKIFGLSETSLSQKITAGVGGVLNGISDTIEFFTGGKVKLLNKEQTYQKLEQLRTIAMGSLDSMLEDHPELKNTLNRVAIATNDALDMTGQIFTELYDSLTGDEIKVPTLNKAIDLINQLFTNISDAITKKIENMTDGLSRTKLGGLLGLRDKNQKALDKASEKRQKIESKIADGKGTFESYNDYTKRMKKLKDQLIKAKEEELTIAQDNLTNGYKDKAQNLILQAKNEQIHKSVKEYEKWSNEKKKVEGMISNDYKIIGDITKEIEKTTDPEQIKMLQIRLNAYGLSVKGLTERLDKIKNEKPVTNPISASIPRFQGTRGEDRLLHTIRNGEGTTTAKAKKHGYKSGYDVTLGYGAFADDKSKSITDMTIQEIYAHQKKMKKNKKNRFSTGRKDKNGKMIKLPSSAVGAYQITEPTLRRLTKKLGIGKNAKFDKATQDKLGLELLKEAGGDKYKKGKITAKQYQNRIAGVWASVATTKGKSRYGQHTGTSSSVIQDSIKEYKSSSKTPSPIVQKDDKETKALLSQLVKNTTPKAEVKKKEKSRDIILNHHVPDSKV